MRISSTFATVAIASTTNAAIHSIAVGQQGLAYTPNTTYAAVGDTIVFSFYPRDHNVVQGSYNTPCQDGESSGIYSGFIPSSEGVANRTFQITLNNTDPIWFYCSQQGGGGHCTKGMVGVINPPSNTNQTLAQYATGASNVKNTSYTQPENVQGGIVVLTGEYRNGTAGGSSGNASYTSSSVTAGVPVATSTSAVGSASSTSTGTASVATNAAAGARALGAVIAAGGLVVALL